MFLSKLFIVKISVCVCVLREAANNLQVNMVFHTTAGASVPLGGWNFKLCLKLSVTVTCHTDLPVPELPQNSNHSWPLRHPHFVV